MATLNKLLQAGLIDQPLYINQTAKLEQSTYQYQQQINHLNSRHTDNANDLEDFRDLLHWCNQGQMLDAFDPHVFETFVQTVKVNSQHEIIFQLKCGLSLVEKMSKKTRVSRLFYRKVIHQYFNDPLKQAEYIYSIIKSEVDLIE